MSYPFRFALSMAIAGVAMILCTFNSDGWAPGIWAGAIVAGIVPGVIAFRFGDNHGDPFVATVFGCLVGVIGLIPVSFVSSWLAVRAGYSEGCDIWEGLFVVTTMLAAAMISALVSIEINRNLDWNTGIDRVATSQNVG